MKKLVFDAGVAGVPGKDPTLPNVELIVSGRRLRLCYDHNAIALADEVTGINLLAAAFDIQTASALRGMLWAASVKAQPDLTIEEAGNLLNPHNFPEVRKALVAAWFESVPEPDVDAGEKKPQASPNVWGFLTFGRGLVTTLVSRMRNFGRSRRGSSTSSAGDAAKI